MGCGCNSSCDCSQVITIPSGGIGPPGPPGSNGTNGTNGTDGSDGAPGSDGSDGAAATITVGTVTTGAAGSSATVTNSGTSSAAVFDFAIPKGDDGADGTPATGGSAPITTTYVDLLTLITSSTLVPGTSYIFPYQTKHIIPYTTDVNTGPVENLMVKAIDTNSLDIRAISLDYPDDIIHYHPLDYTVSKYSGPLTLNLSNDLEPDDATDYTGVFNTIGSLVETGNANSTPAPVTTAGQPVQRTGKIYYREDTINRRSAPYDFRVVKFRRFKLAEVANSLSSSTYKVLQSSYHLTSTLNGVGAPSPIIQGQVIVDDLSGAPVQPWVGGWDDYQGTTYVAKQDFAWDSTIVGIAGHLEFCLPINEVLFDYNRVTFNHSPHPGNFQVLVGDSTGVVGSTELIYAVDSTSYIDFLTFNEGGMTTGFPSSDPSGFSTVWSVENDEEIRQHNCHIKNHVAAYMESVTWEYYNNIIFFGHNTDVVIEPMAQNMNIFSSNSLKIGYRSSDIYIYGPGYNETTTSIGSHVHNAYLYQRSLFTGSGAFSTPGENDEGLVIGDNCQDIIISYSEKVRIGNDCSRILTHFIKDVYLGEGNSLITLCRANVAINAAPIQGFILGKNNLAISCFGSENTMGDYNQSILIPYNGNENTFGSHNFRILPLLAPNGATPIEGIFAETYEGNTFGDHCRFIEVRAENTVFGDYTNVLSTSHVSVLKECVFAPYSGNLRFAATGSTNIFITGSVFSIHQDRFSAQKAIDVNTYSGALNGKNFTAFSVTDNSGTAGEAISSYEISTVDISTPSTPVPTFVTTTIPIT